MHLVGPYLTTTGKKKGKVKWASAEHKRKAEQAEQDWIELQKKWKIDADQKRKTRGLSAPSLSSSYSLKIPEGRDTTSHIKSVDTGGNATLKPAKVYTGTKVKGIATMHKSNAVPVFSDEEAIEISKMRRG
jgi:hypothetical protein